jgi:hypothetical protein
MGYWYCDSDFIGKELGVGFGARSVEFAVDEGIFYSRRINEILKTYRRRVFTLLADERFHFEAEC